MITAAWLKDPTDHQWDNDEEMKAWRDWMGESWELFGDIMHAESA